MKSEILKVHKNIKRFLPVCSILIALLLLSSCADTSSLLHRIRQQHNRAQPHLVQHKNLYLRQQLPSYTGPAVLGAQLSAFTTKFGQPNDHSSSGQPHLARCGNSNVDKLILSQISLESATGPITSILYASCTPWTVSVAEASCSTFFPADAVYQKSVSVLDSSGNLSAFDKIYYSATLAHEFAADNFTDANQNQVKPGLFDANFLYVSDNTNSHIDRCTIQLGTQQTQ